MSADSDSIHSLPRPPPPHPVSICALWTILRTPLLSVRLLPRLSARLLAAIKRLLSAERRTAAGWAMASVRVAVRVRPMNRRWVTLSLITAHVHDLKAGWRHRLSRVYLRACAGSPGGVCRDEAPGSPYSTAVSEVRVKMWAGFIWLCFIPVWVSGGFWCLSLSLVYYDHWSLLRMSVFVFVCCPSWFYSHLVDMITLILTLCVISQSYSDCRGYGQTLLQVCADRFDQTEVSSVFLYFRSALLYFFPKVEIFLFSSHSSLVHVCWLLVVLWPWPVCWHFIFASFRFNNPDIDSLAACRCSSFIF